MDDFDRTLLRVTFVATLVSIFLVGYWLVLAHRTDDAACYLGPGLHAEAHVSIVPPGTTCSYSTSAGAEIYAQRPSYLRDLVLIVAVFGLPFSLFLRRSLSHR